MKIWLGLLLALFSFSASASASASYDKDLDLPSGQVNEQSSPRVAWGGADSLEAARATLNNSSLGRPSATSNMYIYRDQSGRAQLTNANPSGNFDKFTKRVEVSYYKNTKTEKDKEREWERQLNKKPAARIGMSQKQILNNTNWGKPKDTSTTIDASGTLERWMYSSTHSLYFKNGKLIKIEK